MATIRVLAERGIEVHVVHWDNKKLTPYQAPLMNNVYMYKRSELTTGQMKQLANDISPAITVVSGWMDKGYMYVSKQLRSRGVPVVVCFDDQWFGTLRQRFASILAGFGFFSLFYSHAWVTGVSQFEYARRLNFKRKNIIFDVYSADLQIFSTAYESSKEKKKKLYPHCFLFVGRFESVKGLDILIQAWNDLGDKKRDWELHLIGNGSLKSELETSKGIVIRDFMQPDVLVRTVINSGCFILPSRSEPWGVVVHEFASAGLPLIISDAVGAASTFLITGMNGYSFKMGDPKSLATSLQKIISTSDQELCFMAENSHLLSQRITPATSAANLLSIS